MTHHHRLLPVWISTILILLSAATPSLSDSAALGRQAQPVDVGGEAVPTAALVGRAFFSQQILTFLLKSCAQPCPYGPLGSLSAEILRVNE